MTLDEFYRFWISNYQETLPIGHTLKSAYKDRWFRIHSLSEGKRYATSQEEYQIIVDRQNQLITDVIGAGTEIILLLVRYNGNQLSNAYSKLIDFETFLKVETFDLPILNRVEKEIDFLIEFFIKKSKWVANQQNDILKAIADDELRLLFICPKKKRMISPYDGGVDVILESTEIRDLFKNKYTDWLSTRNDGL